MSKYYDSSDETFKAIPDAPYYAMCKDTFMSNWGAADNSTNTVVVPCKDEEEVKNAMSIMRQRHEMQYVRYVIHKPKTRPGVVYSLIPDWATKDPNDFRRQR